MTKIHLTCNDDMSLPEWVDRTSTAVATAAASGAGCRGPVSLGSPIFSRASEDRAIVAGDVPVTSSIATDEPLNCNNDTSPASAAPSAPSSTEAIKTALNCINDTSPSSALRQTATSLGRME